MLLQILLPPFAGGDIRLKPSPFEDEDAHILVYPPEGTSNTDMDRLGDALTERSVEILLDTGLLILIGVYEAPQRRQGTEEPPAIP